MTPSTVHVAVMTAPNPGAVGIIQLHGVGAAALLTQLTGKPLASGRVRLVDFAGIDEGLALVLRDDWAQLMPHGGPRVMHRIVERLMELGARFEPDPPPRLVYPEAASDLEADMLAAIAKAASPAAIDRLLEQPGLWAEWVKARAAIATGESGPHPGPLPTREGEREILARSGRWDRLISPPAVVVVGAPNVGKSTLTNRMLGRSASIVADLPGTTRDWVAGLAEIGPVAVRWMDTPGLRDSDDPIEQQAIALAQQAIDAADVLIAMRDADHDWPALRREPDLRVWNKIDRSAADSNAIGISAQTGTGLDPLERRIIESLGLNDVDHPGMWAFSPSLRRLLHDPDASALKSYATPPPQ